MDFKQIREIIFYGDYFWDSYKKQSAKVKKKINWLLDCYNFWR
jgi:hypothetical protein